MGHGAWGMGHRAKSKGKAEKRDCFAIARNDRFKQWSPVGGRKSEIASLDHTWDKSPAARNDINKKAQNDNFGLLIFMLWALSFSL
jgi:hypothetical protein